MTTSNETAQAAPKAGLAKFGWHGAATAADGPATCLVRNVR
jgi:hypothetical protein